MHKNSGLGQSLGKVLKDTEEKIRQEVWAAKLLSSLEKRRS